QTTQTITVNVSSDTLVEPDETFKVTLSNPSAGTSLATALATGRILETTSAFAIGTSVAKAEGNTGTTPATPFTFTVTRTGSPGAARLGSPRARHSHHSRHADEPTGHHRHGQCSVPQWRDARQHASRFRNRDRRSVRRAERWQRQARSLHFELAGHSAGRRRR